jgi:uncharacterized protein
MNRILLGSLSSGAGKTSIALGLGQSRSGNVGYLKPYGDRPLYKKKRLWDADAVVAAAKFRLGEDPTAVSLGFDHGKIRYMYQGDALVQRLEDLASRMEADREMLVIEGGSELFSGASVNLDVFTLASALRAPLFVVLSGENDLLADQAVYLSRTIARLEVEFGGVIINKVRDPDDFELTCRPILKSTGLPVAGVIPFEKRLASPTVASIAEQLVARAIAGTPSSEKEVEHIFFGAMSAGAAQKSPAFHHRNKLVVTTADHTDLILASLDTDTAAIILAGEPLPHASIMALAEEKNVPVLVVHDDLLTLAGRIQKLEAKLTVGDHSRIDLLGQMVREHVKIPSRLSPTP